MKPVKFYFASACIIVAVLIAIWVNHSIATRPKPADCTRVFPGIEVKYNPLTKEYALHRIGFKKPEWEAWDQSTAKWLTDWENNPPRVWLDSCTAKEEYGMYVDMAIEQANKRRIRDSLAVIAKAAHDSLLKGWK